MQTLISLGKIVELLPTVENGPFILNKRQSYILQSYLSRRRLDIM